MRIIIAGAGDVGFHLAKLLVQENQDIVLIDTDAEKLKHAAEHLDIPTATSLGNVGPTDNFAWLPSVAKWFLAILILIGRLELFTVLILFTPYFWSRY